jgi:hypothetical protein
MDLCSPLQQDGRKNGEPEGWKSFHKKKGKGNTEPHHETGGMLQIMNMRNSCAAQSAREHGIQCRQRETDGSRFEKVSAGNGLAEADVHE